jgi:exonuclease SbcC
MNLDKLVKKKQDFRSRYVSADKQYTGHLQRLSIEGNILRTLGELHAQMGKAMEAEQKLPSITEKLLMLNRKLETKDYSKDLLEDVKDFEKKLFEISYNPSLHKEIKQNIESFQYLETEKKKLDQKLNEKQLLTSEIKKIDEKSEQLSHLIAKSTEEINTITYNAADLDGINKIISLHEASLDEAISIREDLVKNQAGTLEKMSHYKLLETEYEEKNQEYRILYHQEALLQRATDIFSKNGIQSFIIENALPEIENKANQILDIISDGRLQVFFKVQSKTKKGSFKETMDIDISNEGQLRSYELFSGGEKFKVDLAIRIAISYVLSNKSGARLSMLMIDEGFGTQDKDGILRFVECINRISKDFEKVIVVTHLDELKDYFQTLIRVSKKNGFSRVVIE